MLNKIIIAVRFIFFSLVVLSCTIGNPFDGMNEMYFLMADYYQHKLALIKTNGKKITEKYLILDLTELHGNMIIQAGFLTLNTVYIVFEGIRRIPTETTVYVRMYDIINCNWLDVFTYRNEHNNIKIIDIENAGGYFTENFNRNKLMYINFQDQTSSTVYKFSDDEEIIAINCRYSDHFVIINTYEKKKDSFHYYLIDKFSNEKINEGIGKMYLNRRSSLVINEIDSKVFILDDLVVPTKNIEIPVKNNQNFLMAIDVDKDSFIVCFYSKRRDYILSFLFGVEHVIERYDYRYIRLFNDDNLECKKINNNNNYFANKIFFDVYGERR